MTFQSILDNSKFLGPQNYQKTSNSQAFEIIKRLLKLRSHGSQPEAIGFSELTISSKMTVFLDEKFQSELMASGFKELFCLGSCDESVEVSQQYQKFAVNIGEKFVGQIREGKKRKINEH
eukprot:TRINITY_DN1023_c0_g2_i3.p5 TRINITY_DN1023_c0_g2~~TRINITY_DN1023_c0_g2_i3.p5  ORF type:complete len:120 (-),score=13.31 TRINITY_DN1023_c0_g2_i3:403-762(-)